MVLFIAYPSVSIKIFRLFSCKRIDGHYWIAADLRLQCFTKKWCDSFAIIPADLYMCPCFYAVD